jgi:hypothetical protein
MVADAYMENGRIDTTEDKLLLNRALTVLDELDAVYIAEQMPLSLAVMSWHFGVAPPQTYYEVLDGEHEFKREDRRPADHESFHSKEIRDMVATENVLDVELYERAVDRLTVEGKFLFGAMLEECTAYTCVQESQIGLIDHKLKSKNGMLVARKKCTAAFTLERCFPGGKRYFEIGW